MDLAKGILTKEKLDRQLTGQSSTPFMRNRSFTRGRSQSGNRRNYNYRNNYRPNYRNRSRGRWNNNRSGDMSNNYQTNNRSGNTRSNYGQNAQWMFRNRSQSRDRTGNYNNDYMRGRNRDRNNDRPIQSRQSTLSCGRDDSRSRSNSRVSTNCDRVRCYRCREYDHFA